MMLSMRIKVIHQHCDCQWWCMCLNFGRKVENPVTSACAHVPTDQQPIWSDLSFLRISGMCLIICLAPTPVLPEIFLLLSRMPAATSLLPAAHAGKQGIHHIHYNSCCLTSTDTQSRNYCSSSALLALKKGYRPYDGPPTKHQEP